VGRRLGHRQLRRRADGQPVRELSQHQVARLIPAGSPHRRGGDVVGGPIAGHPVTDVIAAFAYDLEAGRPDARSRAEARIADLRTRFAASLRNVATQDSTRAARQLQPLGRPLTDYAGVYEEPAFGKVEFTVQGGRLAFRWGALYGPAEIFDAAKDQMRIELAGPGTVVTFGFGTSGPATSIQLQGTTFTRR
jgi:hypothetical protein